MNATYQFDVELRAALASGREVRGPFVIQKCVHYGDGHLLVDRRFEHTDTRRYRWVEDKSLAESLNAEYLAEKCGETPGSQPSV